jgi:flagellar basal-body rod protein FlgF
MDRGLYIAASGMLTEQLRQKQIANDLANASTPGYKADRTAQRSFGDLMLSDTTTGQTIGRQSTAVAAAAVVTDFTPQPSRDTGEPLDFAIGGEGFFAVRTADGVRYTRDGQFTVSPQGELVTAQGDPVLGRGGQPIRVSADGKVDPRRLDVVLLGNPQKAGDGLVTGTPGATAGQVPGQVRAGALESSGVDPATSMVDMIASLRAFEAGQKAIQAIDDVLGKASNQVGSLS